MRGKIFIVVILLVILLLTWQYLPMLTLNGQPIFPGFKESKHDKYEKAVQTETFNPYDTDGDGLLDYEEDSNGNGIQDVNLGETNILDPDSDNDGLNDGTEFNWWINRFEIQKETGKIPEWVRSVHPNMEYQQHLHLYLPNDDLDGDGLANILDYDSDYDGLSDGEEVLYYGTDPAHPDYDSDKIIDSLDPNPTENLDIDNDGLPDDWERFWFGDLRYGPEDDPDNDDFDNLLEYIRGTNPLNPDGPGGVIKCPSVNLGDFYESDLNKTLFRISPIENPKFWRLTAFDTFDGSQWIKSNEHMNDYQNTVLPEVKRYQTSKNRTFSIQFYGSYLGYVPTALHTTNVYNIVFEDSLLPKLNNKDKNFKPTIYYDNELGFYIDEEIIGFDFTIIDYTYSESMKYNAELGSKDDMKLYLDIPNNIKSNIDYIELAERIIGDSNNNYEKVIKIESFLKGNYSYNLNSSSNNNEPDNDQDPIHNFLFNSKTGICVHFASAFVILCRLSDIPARLALGYTIGEIEKSEMNEYRVVKEKHKHVWPEINFQNLGWLQFDATPTLDSNHTTIKPNPTGDDDNDGLANWEELKFGTNLSNPDTDGDGLNDWYEVKVYLTNPLKKDTDNDFLNDYIEVKTRYNQSNIDWDNDGKVEYYTNPLNLDTDNDGLVDGEEISIYHTHPLKKDSDEDLLDDYLEIHILGTDPNNPDSDNDQLTDGLELDDSDGNTTNPLNPDTDDDGLLDGEEDKNHNGKVDSIDPNHWNTSGLGETDPNNKDTDHGGINDWFETMKGNNPLDKNDDYLLYDTDGDGLTDIEEKDKYYTNWLKPDSDDDGLTDFEEIMKYFTNPLNKDSDGDGIEDKEEIIYGIDGYITDPNNNDTDGDTLNDWDEIHVWVTNPMKADTDGDGLTDDLEIDIDYSKF